MDQRLKSNLLVNKIYECWIKYILTARKKRIISILETIRRLVMSRLQRNMGKMTSWKTQVFPKVIEKLKKNVEKSRECIPLYAGQNVFEVNDII